MDTDGEAPQRRAPRRAPTTCRRPTSRADLGVDDDVQLDDDTIEEVLVPAARRQLAQSRHQLLSTMVLMGINRIVVTSGRVRAKLDFHIDAPDIGIAETASQFDLKHDQRAIGGAGFGFRASARTSVAYVKTAKQVSTDEINVDVDLTGELDLSSSPRPSRSSGSPTRVCRADPDGDANPEGNPVAAPRSTQTTPP